MSAVIDVQSLSKEFREVKAVDDLSFAVPEGQVYGFLGQNGAGKSTTIRMLLTLITPDSGSIDIFGLNLQRNRREILRQVGAIIERPDLYRYLTAMENMRILAKMSGMRIPESRLKDQLDKVGLADRANSRVKTFSQGMKQRLGIATALVHDPKLIILDEPINGLDPQGIADVRNLILHLSNDLGKTVFISSHVLSEMELIADSMLIIDKGKKIAEGNKEKMLNPVDAQVELVTDNDPAALELIKETPWGKYLVENDADPHRSVAGGNILFEIKRSQIPELNRTLVEKGINVVSLRPKHSLEDFFLSLMVH